MIFGKFIIDYERTLYVIYFFKVASWCFIYRNLNQHGKAVIYVEKIVNQGYKFKILPTDEQKDFFLQCYGCAIKI